MPKTKLNLFAAFLCSTLFLTLGATKGFAQTFTTIDIPGATETDCNDINVGGVIAGFYLDSNSLGHGFIRTADGTVRKIDIAGASDTRAYGINDNNDVTGWYIDSATGLTYGFLYTQGKYHKINPPGSQLTNAWSVSNDSKTVVGTYIGSDGVYHGFVFNGGTYTQYDVPGATLTEFTGINRAGSMTGIAIDSNGVQHGFTLQGNKLNQVDYPASGVVVTAADRINDRNEIVGLYGFNTAGPFSGYSRVTGKYNTINYPDSTETRCRGLNNAGDIVGRYTDNAGLIHGMLVTP